MKIYKNILKNDLESKKFLNRSFVQWHSEVIFIKLEVNKIRRRNGCDCWGIPEYDDVYIVLKDNKIIYESESDPTCLINDLLNELTK